MHLHRDFDHPVSMRPHGLVLQVMLQLISIEPSLIDINGRVFHQVKDIAAKPRANIRKRAPRQQRPEDAEDRNHESPEGWKPRTHSATEKNKARDGAGFA
jgi:hypothetical protein